jgi:hypothetical protein
MEEEFQAPQVEAGRGRETMLAPQEVACHAQSPLRRASVIAGVIWCVKRHPELTP